MDAAESFDAAADGVGTPVCTLGEIGVIAVGVTGRNAGVELAVLAAVPSNGVPAAVLALASAFDGVGAVAAVGAVGTVAGAEANC